MWKFFFLLETFLTFFNSSILNHLVYLFRDIISLRCRWTHAVIVTFAIPLLKKCRPRTWQRRKRCFKLYVTGNTCTYSPLKTHSSRYVTISFIYNKQVTKKQKTSIFLCYPVFTLVDLFQLDLSSMGVFLTKKGFLEFVISLLNLHWLEFSQQNKRSYLYSSYRQINQEISNLKLRALD